MYQSLIFHAIELNNAGALNIRRGNLIDSIIILAESLQTYSSWSYEELVQQHCLIQAMVDLISDKKQAAAVNCDYEMELSSHSSNGFVYRQPIAIPSWYCNLPPHQSNVVVSVTIIFNLALAHHLCAMEKENKSLSLDLLQRAATLYEQGIYLSLTHRDQKSNALVLLATINNLGQIHKSLDDRENSEKCDQHLLKTLMLLIHSPRGGKGSEFEEFFRNVGYLVFDKRCKFAAAA